MVMEDETTAFEEIKNDIGERQLMDESSEYNETISEEIMHVFNYNVLEYVVQGYFMPVVSLFGLAGNTVSIYILSHKDVKLKKDFSKVLVSLASFDNFFLICSFFLFSLKDLSQSYYDHVWLYVSPYLFPLTNTLMTCSTYMTAAVAVNRYLDVISADNRYRHLRMSGYAQAMTVLLCATLVNVPRWFEHELPLISVTKNITDPLTGQVMLVNVTKCCGPVEPTELRLNQEYIKYYILIASTVLVALIPMLCMLITTLLIYQEMTQATRVAQAVYSDGQEQARRRRNRNISLMLTGVIVLNFACNIGEVVLSGVELGYTLRGSREVFAQSKIVVGVITINNFLKVVNSSLNFVIYCKDVVFRQCVMMLYHAWKGNSEQKSAVLQLRSINKELGISLTGDANAEVVLKQLDPQSAILCGIGAKV